MDASTPSRPLPQERTAPAPWHPPGSDTIALVLQGGGALGAYKAGAYQALHEAGLEPDTVAGMSIGGINAAIIAGNPPERRGAGLGTDAVAHTPPPPPPPPPGG